MASPLISFIVVTHNRPVELVTGRVIRSIAEQSYASRELIVVGENCFHFASLVERVRTLFPALPIRCTNVLRRQYETNPRALAAKCRNVGVAMASGEFISCQDDDNELDREFAASLLECLLSTGAEAAWCHRRVVMPDGSRYPGTFFPWADPISYHGKLIYDIWCAAGVIVPGSDVIRDQLLATYNSETFSTVDANEWLVRAEIYRQFPFREKYGYYDLMGNASFDDIWNLNIRAAGVRAVSSEKVGLTYHLGGQSNKSFVDCWHQLSAMNGTVNEL